MLDYRLVLSVIGAAGAVLAIAGLMVSLMPYAFNQTHPKVILFLAGVGTGMMLPGIITRWISVILYHKTSD